MTTQKNSYEKTQEIIHQIDLQQTRLEKTQDGITAMILSGLYHELEVLGFDYDVFSKELTFVF